MNVFESVIKDHYEGVCRQFDINLTDYLVKNLSDLGFVFKDKEEFIVFVKERLTRVSDWESRKHSIFLDYIDEHNTGKIVGIYSDQIDIDFDNFKSTMTITIGK